MRIRTNIIIEESLLAKIDEIAGDKQKRTNIIETALLEFIARNESKVIDSLNVETAHQTVISVAK
jgi:metal-responsive CopG/Arc/MetJ family transcriptional regulator